MPEKVTLKRAAEMLGLTKNTVKSRLKAHPEIEQKREGNLIYISIADLDIIANAKTGLKPPKTTEEPVKTDSKPLKTDLEPEEPILKPVKTDSKTDLETDREPVKSDNIKVLQDTISTLQDQIKVLTDQLSVKDDQIRTLTILLENQQKLSVMYSLPEPDHVEGKKKKRNLFNSIFGNKSEDV